jgi:hypothetical protein
LDDVRWDRLEDFLLRPLLLEDERRDGTLPPSLRASLNPIAIACLRLVTFRPEPDRNVPCFRSCIALWTLSCAFRPYFAMNGLLQIDQALMSKSTRR